MKMKIIVKCILLFGSCVSIAISQPDRSALIWPPPPQPPRIKHIQTFSSFKDIAGEEKGFFSRVLKLFFGEDQEERWLVQPVGIAVDLSGTMYITDPGARGIHIINRTEKEYQFLSRTDGGDFISPVGIAVGNDGTLWISDSQRGEVIALDDDHDVTFVIKKPLVRPTGILILGDRLYVVDTGAHKIFAFDLKGNLIAAFGGRGTSAGEFNFPIYLAGKHSLYVVDALNYRIQSFDLDGSFRSSFGEHGNAEGMFASPKAAALDSDGNIYVTDVLLDNFQVFNQQGQLLLVVGHKGTQNGEFLSPSGITIDKNDYIYVVDSLNRRIQIFQYLNR